MLANIFAMQAIKMLTISKLLNAIQKPALLFLFFISSHAVVAQTHIATAGRISTLVAPAVLFESYPFGFGAELKIDWLNSWKRKRFFQVTFDKYNLLEEVTRLYSIAPFLPQYNDYSVSFTKLVYGFRAQLTQRESGLYAELSLGFLISKVDGSSDKDLNNSIGITGAATPGLGYNKGVLDLGLECMFAPSKEGYAVVPAAHVGFRFNAKAQVETTPK